MILLTFLYSVNISKVNGALWRVGGNHVQKMSGYLQKRTVFDKKDESVLL